MKRSSEVEEEIMSSFISLTILSEEQLRSSEVSEERERAILDHEIRARGAPLLQAIMKGDWPFAEAFLDKNKDFVRCPITKEQGTTLHIATVTKRASFVEELLKLMTSEDLVLTNKKGMTALHFAAQTGVVRIAKMMVEKNNKLSLIPDENGRTPLNEAAYRVERNMVDYLYSVTPLSGLTPAQLIELLFGTISAGHYDLALNILKLDQYLALTDHNERALKALELLARKPCAIGSESQLPSWKKRLNSC